MLPIKTLQISDSDGHNWRRSEEGIYLVRGGNRPF
jgi:hypothetical protein